MPESIIVHFGDATGSVVFPFLAARCGKASDREIYFYPNNAAYVLNISEYPDYEVEYDEEEKARVEAILERRPSFSLSIELRRSKQDDACDAAIALVSELGTTHNLVIDDCFRLWTRCEIQSEGDFLRVYRSGKRLTNPHIRHWPGASADDINVRGKL